jgi:hypothetical protein
MTPDGHKLALPVDPKLRISRLSRMVGWGRYKIVLDGGEVGTLARGKNVEMEIAPGAHALQLFYRFGLRSPAATFSIFAGETAAFACYPPSYVATLPRLVAVLLLQRGSWITLDHTADDKGGGDESSQLNREQQSDLMKKIAAGRTNVRTLVTSHSPGPVFRNDP